MPDVPAVGSVVELRPDLDHFYNGATAGWRGTVKARKDDDGFDLIFVEWDTDYWRYDPTAGQADGWTYPAHFEVVGALSTTPEAFAAEMTAERPEQCEHCGSDHSEEDRRAAYVNLLAQTASQASQGDGFALIWVQREETDNSVHHRPYMVTACLTEESLALIEGQIVTSAQESMGKFIAEYLRKFE